MAGEADPGSRLAQRQTQTSTRGASDPVSGLPARGPAHIGDIERLESALYAGAHRISIGYGTRMRADLPRVVRAHAESRTSAPCMFRQAIAREECADAWERAGPRRPGAVTAGARFPRVVTDASGLGPCSSLPAAATPSRLHTDGPIASTTRR